jgi:hypothetical protein
MADAIWPIALQVASLPVSSYTTSTTDSPLNFLLAQFKDPFSQIRDIAKEKR